MDVADYFITILGFERFTPFMERNVYIRLLMSRGLSPFLSATVVFLITFLLTLASYFLVRSYLTEEPYSEGLGDVGRYLWNSESVSGRDLTIFVALTLYIIFLHLHLTGLLSWLSLFLR
ncbi:hypothetical protein CW700_04120 [Candidatus Bathyarchaeota archaeon]|nr:MAG: hypothetical protein CW700_04120 [Candidatus Bathyarchaeota archaeon]